MDYISKIRYTDNLNYMNRYKDRFNFETTLKIQLRIKPYKCDKYYQLYYVYNNKTSQFVDEIRKNDALLKNLDAELPKVAKNAFLVNVISSELKSTNDLEGVESSKETIAETTKNLIEKKISKNNKDRMISMINSYYLLTIDNTLKEPQSPKDIRKIYDKITESEIDNDNLPDGDLFRRDDVYVTKKGSPSGDYIHRGVIGEEEIKEHLSNMLLFLENESIPLLVRAAIGHYYFGYIHPFYDGNGRVGRFISSLYINKEYNYLTAMSIARGCIIKKSDYYKAFKEANSEKMMGEMNYFIDTFLEILIEGQKDIIDNLYEKKHKLEDASILINKDNRLNSELSKGLLFMLTQSYYFCYNLGIEREELIEYSTKENHPVLRIKNELKRLETKGLIVTKKKRPLIYALSNSYIDYINGKN